MLKVMDNLGNIVRTFPSDEDVVRVNEENQATMFAGVKRDVGDRVGEAPCKWSGT